MKPGQDPFDGEVPIPPEFSDDEAALLRRYLNFYRSLETGQRIAATDAQRHFVAMCEGQAIAANEHERVYAKYMRLRPGPPPSVTEDWRDRYDREH